MIMSKTMDQNIKVGDEVAWRHKVYEDSYVNDDEHGKQRKYFLASGTVKKIYVTRVGGAVDRLCAQIVTTDHPYWRRARRYHTTISLNKLIKIQETNNET
jgi:hypothetical protein